MGFLNPVNTAFCLEQVCASNYEKLFRLIPDLTTIRHKAIGEAPNHSHLFLRIIDHSAYTLTIELTHCFSKQTEELLEPAVRIRIYLDARLAEVLSDHARPRVEHAIKDIGLCREILNYKWRLNFFLQKWLDHCLSKDYRFTAKPMPI